MGQQDTGPDQAQQNMAPERERFLRGMASNLANHRTDLSFGPVEKLIERAQVSGNAASLAWLEHPGMIPENEPHLVNRAMIAVDVYTHPDAPAPFAVATVNAPFAMQGGAADLDDLAMSLVKKVVDVTLANAFSAKTKPGRQYLSQAAGRIVRS